MSEVRYLVSVGKLYCSSEQLDGIVKAVRGLDRMELQYQGKEKGEFGTDYKWELRKGKADEVVSIDVVPEGVSLYLNTFGKEETNDK